MALGQHGAKQHSEQRPSEDAREHDPTNGQGTHETSLLAITASGTRGMSMLT